jgi:precorrin isomerase
VGDKLITQRAHLTVQNQTFNVKMSQTKNSHGRRIITTWHQEKLGRSTFIIGAAPTSRLQAYEPILDNVDPSNAVLMAGDFVQGIE